MARVVNGGFVVAYPGVFVAASALTNDTDKPVRFFICALESL
jgi:hypothetical protein